MAAVIDRLDSIEIGLCLRINQLGRRTGVRACLQLASKLGDGGFWFAMAISVLAIRGSAALISIGEMMIAATVGVVIYKLLKQKLIRERPYIAHGEIQLGATPLDRYSFPSGHTLHAVSFTILFGDLEPMSLFVALPFAILVAISRVVLGLHYPSDVLVGAIIGSGIAVTTIAIG